MNSGKRVFLRFREEVLTNMTRTAISGFGDDNLGKLLTLLSALAATGFLPWKAAKIASGIAVLYMLYRLWGL